MAIAKMTIFSQVEQPVNDYCAYNSSSSVYGGSKRNREPLRAPVEREVRKAVGQSRAVNVNWVTF